MLMLLVYWGPVLTRCLQMQFKILEMSLSRTSYSPTQLGNINQLQYVVVVAK